jgi:hypothetical protein
MKMPDALSLAQLIVAVIRIAVDVLKLRKR